MAQARFAEVPNFSQATFSEAPRLEIIHVEPGGFWKRVLARVRHDRKANPDRTARWRDLKRLAIQAHDHQLEQRFFREELRARRWAIQKPWHPSFWASLVYQGLSDFGGSLVLPLVWWAAQLAGFALVYLDRHAHLRGGPDLGCVAGTGEPTVAAFGLSLHKALPFIGGGDKLSQIYACLYGMEYFAVEVGGQTVGRVMPVIPDGVAAWGVLQLLFSGVLIFLFLLAVRNHFKIK